MEAELTGHPGYEKHDRGEKTDTNRRNGTQNAFNILSGEQNTPSIDGIRRTQSFAALRTPHPAPQDQNALLPQIRRSFPAGRAAQKRTRGARHPSRPPRRPGAADRARCPVSFRSVILVSIHLFSASPFKERS
jgi:hypothetical protein